MSKIEDENLARELREKIAAIAATGANGFEGLIRDAYYEATGVRLRLLKSGQQQGADAIAVEDKKSIYAAIEAKRYGQGSELSLDHLRSKLESAIARRGNPVELWILAASREVSGDDAEDLMSLGAQRGVAVLILDWGAEGDLLAPLPLLLALAPKVVSSRFDSGFASRLASVRRYPDFDDRAAALKQRLTGGDLGLVYTADVLHTALEKAMMSRSAALQAFGSSANLKDNSRIRISRPSISKRIDAWWEHNDAPVGVCLGEAGYGKSWSALDWILSKQESDQRSFVAWLAARDLNGKSVADAVAQSLVQWLPELRRDKVFWRQRVERWRAAAKSAVETLDATAVPALTLVLDGVNEGDRQQEVLNVLLNAVSDDWKGVVKILITERTPHWREVFNEGKGLSAHPFSVDVGPFSAHELETLLSAHERRLSDFPQSVRDLLCVPRWFEVASTLFGEKIDWAAMTPDGLMFHYWAVRLRDRGAISDVSADRFRNFIVSLGRTLKASDGGAVYGRDSLLARLSGSSGRAQEEFQSAIDDIVDGHWFEEDQLDALRLTSLASLFAIGLAQLDDLKRFETDEEIDEALSAFLGPIEELDEGVSILKSTAVLAFCDHACPVSVRQALIRRWSLARNFNSSDYELFWRMGIEAPQAHLRAAKDVWIAQTGSSFVDHLWVGALASLAQEGGQRDAVVTFLTDEMRVYWHDSHEGLFIGYHPSEEDVAARTVETKQKLAEIERIAEGAGQGLQFRDNGAGASWLHYRLFAVASHLPRAALGPFFRAWAVSRAVIGGSHDFDLLCWLLRENRVDPLETDEMVIETARFVRALGHDLFEAPSENLLTALATPTANAVLAEWGTEPKVGRWYGHENAVTVIDNEIRRRRGDDCVDPKIFDIAALAFDPSLALDRDLEPLLDEAPEDLAPDALGNGRFTTAADIERERSGPAWARWRSAWFADLHRTYVNSAPDRTGEAQRGVSFDIHELVVLLSENTKDRLANMLPAMAPNKSDNWFVLYRFWAAALFDRPAQEQIEIWRKIPPIAAVPYSLDGVLRTPSIRLAEPIWLTILNSDETDEQVFWLCYMLMSRAPLCGRWKETIDNCLQSDCATVRELVLLIALEHDEGSIAAGERLYARGWTASAEQSDRERRLGSDALVSLAQKYPLEDLLARIDKAHGPTLWRAAGFPDEHCGLIFDLLNDALRDPLAPFRGRSKPEAFAEGLRTLYNRDPKMVRRFGEQLFEAPPEYVYRALPWPHRAMLRLFLETEPDFAVGLIDRLPSATKNAFSYDLRQLSLSAPDHAIADRLRREALKTLVTDWDIEEFAADIVAHGREAWAAKIIREDVSSFAPAGTCARAMMLAGFLASLPAVAEIWENELAQAPAEGWLTVVYKEAAWRARRARANAFWWQKATNAESDEAFFCAMFLFDETLDWPQWRLAGRVLRASRDDVTPRYLSAIDLAWDDFKQRVDRRKTKRDRRLYAENTGPKSMMPWA